MWKEVIFSSVILLLLDSVYLTLIGKAYSQQIFNIQKLPMKVNFRGALFSYLFLIIGLNYFIILRNKSALDAGILGTVIYGVYDATSYALLKDWDETLAVIDTLWGGVLLATTTFITKFWLRLTK
jgi:uncharacterized membrane protein